MAGKGTNSYLISNVDGSLRRSTEVGLENLHTNQLVTTIGYCKGEIKHLSEICCTKIKKASSMVVTSRSRKNDIHIDEDVVAAVEDAERDGSLGGTRHLLVLQEALLS